MLVSAPSFQPQIPGLVSPRNSLDNNKSQTESSTKKEEDTLNTESSQSTRKALAELTKAEQAEVIKLKKRDLEVKAHELAHLSAAGSIARGGASFTYTTGPNGVRYATGGEVSIDTSEVANDPAATISKAARIRRAALAPANPSSQDRSVASRASALEQKARVELSQESLKELEATKETKEPEDTENIGENEETTASNKIFNGGSVPIAGSFVDVVV